MRTAMKLARALPTYSATLTKSMENPRNNAAVVESVPISKLVSIIKKFDLLGHLL